LQPTAWSNAGQMVPAILRGLTKTPYAREGAYALAMLAVLALTSNRLSIRLLRHHWNRLHRLVYLAVPLAIYHYWQREEFTVFTGETPDYWRPATFALIVAILLTVRIPPVRQWLAAQLKFVPLPNRVARTRRQTQIRTPTAMTVHRTGQGSGRSSVLPIHAQRTDGFEAQPRVHHQRTSVEGAETATQVHPPEEPVLEREAR
jgi:predicted ferric reductase